MNSLNSGTEVTSVGVSDHQKTADSKSPTSASLRLARRLRALGVFGLVAAVVFGSVGWVLVGRVSAELTATFEPMSEVVTDIADTIAASETLVAHTTNALSSIENATRSTARTIEAVNEVLGESAGLAGDEVADSLDTAVESLPGLIATAQVVDRTMRALSLLGVDYDPEQPLDESLSELETSLRPVPEQIRDQARLLLQARSDIGVISTDAGDLADVLLETQTQLTEAQQVLADASTNAAEAADGVTAITEDLDTYTLMARALVVVAALAMAAGSATPFLIGLDYTRARKARHDSQ